MKAIRLHARGGPEQLFFEDVPKPVAEPGYAIVRVIASGITPAELTWDETYQTCDGRVRIPSTPGHEVSGLIDEVPPDVADLRAGDEVYGLTEFCRDGSAAEFVAVRASDLAPKPKFLSHAQTAAVPLSALTAWQALLDRANLQSGQRVLIHGAAGGVGTYAVQLAKWRGAPVVATAARRDFEFLRGLGADQVIDYASERFEDNVRDIDVVLDPVGRDTLERSWSVLRKSGILVTLPAPIPADSMARAEAQGLRGVFFIVAPNRRELIQIADLLDTKKIRPIIGATVPLHRAREAFECGLGGGIRGKIVLQVAEEQAVAA
jgi:NADPH:quinone reductase-like Zn-dependent oxidoreductase